MFRTFFRPAAAALALVAAMLFPALASTQAADATTGLTVTGFGEASAPAETATIQLGIGMESFGPPQPPDPDATPGAEEREMVAPILRLLTDVGVADEAITTILTPYLSDAIGFSGGPPVGLVRVELDSADPDRITEVVDAAIVGAAQQRLIVGQVAVTYGVSNCDELHRAAHEAAIADGREQARQQADLLGVGLGQLQGARDVTWGIGSLTGVYGPGLAASCSPIDTGRFVPLYSLPAFDPSAEPVVTVYAQMELTFQMFAGPAATPAG